MTCDETTPMLLGFELGGCEEPARAALEGHLAGCPKCLARYFSLKRVGESAAALDERPSSAVRERVRARAVSLGLTPKRRRLGLALALAAAAALLVLLAVRLLSHPAALHPPAADPGLIDSSSPTLDVF